MKILVIGSFNESKQDPRFEEFKAAGRRLGAKLAAKGATIYVGSDRDIDIDTYVVEGAENVEGPTKIVVYRTDSWPDFPFVEKKKTSANLDIAYLRVADPWERATIHIVEQVDVVVVVGGGKSTGNTGWVAPSLKKPVIALSHFPGASEAAFEAYESDYRAVNMDMELIEALKNKVDTPEDADEVVEAIEFMRANNPYRKETSLLLRFAILAVVLGIVFLWGTVLILGNSTWHLMVMLMISALLGTALRAGLRALHDKVIRLSDILNEFTVGLLLAFSLLLVYLAGGIIYEGDVLEVCCHNFKRTAVSVSALALASAFLLEQTAALVRRRLGEMLQ